MDMRTPATPENPKPDEVERSRWLRGRSGRGGKGRRRETDSSFDSCSFANELGSVPLASVLLN
jgi:hypothetical protein